MEQILPGVYHWATFHEGIGEEVHSALITGLDPPALIDPRVPEQGLEVIAQLCRPQHAYLTNRHHYRHSPSFRDAYGTQIWCHRAGLHEFPDDSLVHPFEHGDELPGGIVALPVGELCPEETALFIPLAGGVLALGDAVIRYQDELLFVPDFLLGDDPVAVRRGLRQSLRKLLEVDFDHLLFAHGPPWIGGGRERLRRFVDGSRP
ncbi:MAG: hypothetical protein IH614_12690 [Desulfuromonadales bacterium]|nr:hypothetical protein [Desulfuromonadales bacterium]